MKLAFAQTSEYSKSGGTVSRDGHCVVQVGQRIQADPNMANSSSRQSRLAPPPCWDWRERSTIRPSVVAARHGLPFLVRAWQGELEVFRVFLFIFSSPFVGGGRARRRSYSCISSATVPAGIGIAISDRWKPKDTRAAMLFGSGFELALGAYFRREVPGAAPRFRE